MSLSGFLPAVSRRAMVVGSIAALVGVVSGSGLQAKGAGQQQQTTAQPPQTPQTPAPAQKDPLTFTTAGPRLVIITLSADAGKAFQDALAKAKDAMAKPDAKPELKQQAAHWKVLTATNEMAPTTDGGITLIMTMDQTVPNVTYNPFGILAASGLTSDQFKSDIQPLEDRVNVKGGITGFLPFLLTPAIDMATAAGGGH